MDLGGKCNPYMKISSNEFNSSELIFIFRDNFTVPAMLDDAGRKSHAVDCDVANIVRILLTLKILSNKVPENHLYAYTVVALQDDFSVLSDCFHD